MTDEAPKEVGYGDAIAEQARAWAAAIGEGGNAQVAIWLRSYANKLALSRSLSPAVTRDEVYLACNALHTLEIDVIGDASFGELNRIAYGNHNYSPAETRLARIVLVLAAELARGGSR